MKSRYKFAHKDDLAGSSGTGEVLHVIIHGGMPEKSPGTIDDLPGPFDPVPDGPLIDPLGISPTE